MSTLAEIEQAIITLPAAEVEKLVEWLGRQRPALLQPPKTGKREAVAAFLRRWTGSANAMAEDAMDAHRTTRLMEKHVK
jgi:hypothetical protein